MYTKNQYIHSGVHTGDVHCTMQPTNLHPNPYTTRDKIVVYTQTVYIISRTTRLYSQKTYIYLLNMLVQTYPFN